MTDPAFHIRPIEDADRLWVEELIAARWGAPYVIAHGDLIVPADLPGFVALAGGTDDYAGLVTYRMAGNSCEIVTLDSLQPFVGIGTALVEAVTAVARAAGSNRLWLITTNDNLDALRFYQRRGFRLVRVDPGAIDRSRRLKPIPSIGEYGIPVRDELELERRLDVDT